MHNDTIKVANKIITADVLLQIFEKMHSELLGCDEIYADEVKKNEGLDYREKKWTLKSYSGSLKFDINFHDDTSAVIDDYDYFISVFNKRLSEIKSVYVTYGIYYWEESGLNDYQDKCIHQRITMYIRENAADIDSTLSSNSNIMIDTYNFIKEKILTAPKKYNKIIKNKFKIIMTIEFAVGLIPAMVVALLLLFYSPLRTIFTNGIILYPIANILLGFLFGQVLYSGKMAKLYENISPERVYAGYNKSTYKSIYKDDIKDYTEKSEILIGKNYNNLRDRKTIKKLYNKYKKYLPIELLIIIVISIIVLVIK